MLFYASPVLYVATMVPDELPARRTCANPIAAILTQMRHAVIDPTAPTAADGDRRHRAAADPAGDRRRSSFALGALGVQARGAADRGEPVSELHRPTSVERELEALRARVAELERERAEQAARGQRRGRRGAGARRTGSTAGTSTSTR